MTATQAHRDRDIADAIAHLFAAIRCLKHHGFGAEVQVIDLAINLTRDTSGVDA
jgi:hypothetical protein